MLFTGALSLLLEEGFNQTVLQRQLRSSLAWLQAMLPCRMTLSTTKPTNQSGIGCPHLWISTNHVPPGHVCQIVLKAVRAGKMLAVGTDCLIDPLTGLLSHCPKAPPIVHLYDVTTMAQNAVGGRRKAAPRKCFQLEYVSFLTIILERLKLHNSS